MKTFKQTVSETAQKSQLPQNLETSLAKKYGRAKEAALRLSIAKSTLWQWASERKNEGFPQPIVVGQKVTLWDLNAIDAFVAAQAVKGGA